MRHFKQGDIRKAAAVFGAIQKAERLGRGRAVLMPLYEKRNQLTSEFHHQHSFAEEVNLYLRQNPEIMKAISVPK